MKTQPLASYFVKIKKDTLVEITLPKNNNQIFASRYLTILPSKRGIESIGREKRIDKIYIKVKTLFRGQ